MIKDDLDPDADNRIHGFANGADEFGTSGPAPFDIQGLQTKAADQISQHAETLVQQLRSADLKTATREISDFARKNPALFIGGAALLGLAATRFLKARDPREATPDAVSTDPWADPSSEITKTRGFDVQS